MLWLRAILYQFRSSQAILWDRHALWLSCGWPWWQSTSYCRRERPDYCMALFTYTKTRPQITHVTYQDPSNVAAQGIPIAASTLSPSRLVPFANIIPGTSYFIVFVVEGLHANGRQMVVIMTCTSFTVMERPLLLVD